MAFYLGKKSLNFVIRQIIDILASLRYTNVETKLCCLKGELTARAGHTHNCCDKLSPVAIPLNIAFKLNVLLTSRGTYIHFAIRRYHVVA